MSQNNGTSHIQIRRARLADVAQMTPLLNEYARQAEILPRTEADVYQSIRDWVVAEVGGYHELGQLGEQAHRSPEAEPNDAWARMLKHLKLNQVRGDLSSWQAVEAVHALILLKDSLKAGYRSW